MLTYRESVEKHWANTWGQNPKMSRQQIKCNLQEMTLIMQNMYIYRKRKTKNITGQLLHGEGEVLTHDA